MSKSSSSMSPQPALWRAYLNLTKPGVLFGNVITGVAGFCLASAVRHSFDLGLFLAAIGGMTLIIAAACTLNNVLDRDIDQLMARTKKRGVASGTIKPRHALLFMMVLLATGLAVLALWTNVLVVAIGMLGFIVYVWLYGALSKRRSVHGTVVGSISGAAPILAGYVAVSGRIDAAAVLLFLTLFFWQFPEFYSIAIYRREEYAAAGVPIITVVKGVGRAKFWIAVNAVLFIVAALLLSVWHYTGWVYAGVMAAVGVYWLAIAARGFRTNDQTVTDAWARKMFHASLNVILLYSLLLAIGPLLP